jgi:ATP-binding cassette subfamily C protein LapB
LDKNKSYKDPLLECLVFLTAHYSQARSKSSILAGLPYDGKNMGPELFCEAAEKNDFKSKIVKKRKIEKIIDAVLPVVLILKENKACVLLHYQNKEEVIVWSPETCKEEIVSLKDLQDQYTGYTIYIHPKKKQFNTQNNSQEGHWFWSVFFESKAIYGRVIVAAILINLFALTSPIFIMNVYNRVIPNNAIETGWVLGLGALTVFVFDFIMRTLRGYFIDIAGRRIDVIAGRRIFDQLLNIKLAERPQSSGAFANMLRDFDSVRDFMTSASMTILIDLPFTLFFLSVIWLLGGPVAFLLAALVCIVFLAGVLLQIPLKSVVKKAAKSAEEKHGLLIETIHGLEAIKAVGADGRMREQYSKLIAENAALSQKSRFISALGGNISSWIQQTASIFVVLMGMYLIRDAEMSVGALIACVLLTSRAIAPIGQVANLMSRYHTARTSLATLNDIMKKPVERPASKRFLHRPDIKGKVTFKRVSFIYPKTNRKIIDGCSFIVNAGEKVGLIGRIGSGKSTIAKLMMGLYDSSEGHLLLDDTDYEQIDPADLRSQVAYISQDVVLFNGTVRDNITATKPNATEEEILTVAKASGVHDFIAQHPMGYDAPVGEHGLGLSGGQRQCVALARAMLLQPKVYICDEPTNAMDIQAENSFTQMIKDQTDDKTLILITHRHHLLSLVDRIILIDQGRIIMDGARDDVLNSISSGQLKVQEGKNS